MWTKTFESLPPERDDQQATHEESVKGRDTWATMTAPPIHVSRDERISGPERDQPATHWAHETELDRRRSSLVKPFQDRAPPPIS